MELEELEERLPLFLRTMTEDPFAKLLHIERGTGHAGFSYLFEALVEDQRRGYFLRMPPPNAKWEGTADVLRQVCALNAIDGTDVPHASVIWSGDDPQWFGCPYFVQPWVPGDVLRYEWLDRLAPEHGPHMARQVMSALASIHRVDWRAKCGYLGDFTGLELDVTRWDRTYERVAEPQLLALQPRIRELLLAKMPPDPHVGLFHGDCHWGNMMFTDDGNLEAVIDWELTGIGATLNDVGWILFFSEPRAWNHPDATPEGKLPGPDELATMYTEAWGADPGDLRWFKALAAYKFALISGFNLNLHRRGKRDDPHWEVIAPSMKANMEYAVEMLRG